MASENYRVHVAKKAFSAASGDFEFQPPVINALMTLSASDELTFSFDGFEMSIKYFRGTNSEVQYTLTKHGHPLNGKFAVAFGTTILDPGAGGATTFRQLDVEINVSLTEKYRVTLNKS